MTLLMRTSVTFAARAHILFSLDKELQGYALLLLGFQEQLGPERK